MDDIPIPLPAKPVKFMDQLRAFIRSKQLAYRTEKTYCRWIADFIRFHNMKHPKDLGQEHVESYLSALAVQRHVAINTQKTALNALVFLYQKFFDQKLEQIPFTKAGKPRRLPVVFSHEEAAAVLSIWLGNGASWHHSCTVQDFVLWRLHACGFRMWTLPTNAL